MDDRISDPWDARTPAAFAVLGTTALRFAVIGLVLVVLALYAALAIALEGAYGRTVVPIGRHGPQ